MEKQGRFALGGRVLASSNEDSLPVRPLESDPRFVVASVLATTDEKRHLQEAVQLLQEIGAARSMLVATEEVQRLQEIIAFGDEIAAFVSDPAIQPADVWTPYASGGGLLGDLRQALRLVRAGPQPDRKTGEGVNVVILDYGISKDWLRRASGQQELLGWSRYPCSSPVGSRQINPGDEPPGLDHGHMIARLILAIAPGVRIWDAPLLPDTVLGPPGVTTAESMFERIRRDIVNRRKRRDENPANDRLLPPGPWILVNAWGVLDPFRYDPYPDDSPMAYWHNPAHGLVQAVAKLSRDSVDVVFAAGNCGTPGAHPLCAESAIGPGRSIIGANAHPSVLTVGAVRVDGVPIGTSAQGPGALAKLWPGNRSRYTPDDDPYQKPDLCAPSHFRDAEDANLLNTGTSAACGIAAGIIAALRSAEVEAGLWSGEKRLQGHGRPRTPPELRTILRKTARGAEEHGWDPRLGWGIADLAKARRDLEIFL
jgi:hypothetical protein